MAVQTAKGPAGDNPYTIGNATVDVKSVAAKSNENIVSSENDKSYRTQAPQQMVK